jgi:dihydropteroate synthase
MDTGIGAPAAVSQEPLRRSFTPPVPPHSERWRLRLPRGRELALGGAPRVMGVVNITPDSFSDGGRFLDPQRAIEHARALIEAGADLLDLGAESTRPGGGIYGEGAQDVPAEEEIDRLGPVLEALRGATDLPLSVDTRKGAVASWALGAGADLVNDVSAGADPALVAAVAAAGCPLVLMHSRGEIRTMQTDLHYEDVVTDVRRELVTATERAGRAGIPTEQILLDPGIGFAKSFEQNLLLLKRLDRLAELGRPLVVGASRKGFIGHLTGEPVERRLPGSLAAVAWAAAHGAAVVRVHDVAETAQFLRVWSAVRNAGGGDE